MKFHPLICLVLFLCLTISFAGCIRPPMFPDKNTTPTVTIITTRPTITVTPTTSLYPASPSPPVLRTILFSGYSWWVKTNTSPAGPGPNLFSGSTDNVRVDEQGRLHMKITKNKGRWECAEIVSNESLGYGEYVFTLDSDPGTLDENVVLGLFTWDDHPDYHYREIDLEFSRWEDPKKSNAQYVLQPWDFSGHIHRFDVRTGGRITTHTFNWQPGRIAFRSYFGPYTVSPGPEILIQSWDYTGSGIPPPGDENARINLWLVNGTPPGDGKESEIIIREFWFIP